jgi:tetratricopeptide (TPR) repeat protein
VISLADLRLRRRQYDPAAKSLLELHKSLTQTDNNDPDGEWEAKVTGKLAQLYNSWGNQQETEHWKQIWVKLMRAQVAKLSDNIAGKRGDAALFRSRAMAYSSLGELDQAASDWATALSLDPDGAMTQLQFDVWSWLPFEWIRRASLLAYLKDADAYKEHCRLMLDRYGEHRTRQVRQSGQVRMFTAKCCLLLPQAPLELKRIADVVDGAEGPTAGFSSEWFLTAKGLAEYRLGHYQQAIDWSTKGRDENYVLEEKIENELILAMASFKLGRNDQARAALAKAADQIDKDLPHLGIGDINDMDLFNGWGVEGWLTCHILLREANDLISRGETDHAAAGFPLN